MKTHSSTAMTPDDWTLAGSSKLQFSTFNNDTTMADAPIVIRIVDDLNVEARESLICNLQAGVVDRVQTENPKQVTISIEDNEGIIFMLYFSAH